MRRELGAGAVRLDPADRWAYGSDNSRRHALPAAVLLPSSEAQIQAAVALCHEHGVPLTTRGRGTGTTGAAVPEPGGVVLSLERMDRILEVAPGERLLVAEPGVTNQAVQEAAGRHGFFWAPDPTSAPFCTVGGNLACNAAGPRAVKYGTPRENTLALHAVDGTGQPLRTGVRTSKGVVGYDLTRLLIGSEGTLAVITRATLRLLPLPEARGGLQAWYRDMHAAARAVARLMAQPATPCALEFVDGAALGLMRRQGAGAGIPEEAGALLLVEADGPAAALGQTLEALAEAAAGPGLVALRLARDEAQRQALWATRKALSPALRHVAPLKINEDVVVPVPRMAELTAGLEALGRRHGIAIVNFGHAGNGNIHVNLLLDPAEPGALERAERCLEGIFELVLALGGTLSGEHGVGRAKRPYVARELDPRALALMHALKAAFDPRGILNPGKTLPPLEHPCGGPPGQAGPAAG
ncbi:MAG: FAD-binding protein [Gammaproteobacteria bacterium]|nr:MAG: FAD-binding protein [Gammaproteobacteria bacterium]